MKSLYQVCWEPNYCTFNNNFDSQKLPLEPSVLARAMKGTAIGTPYRLPASTFMNEHPGTMNTCARLCHLIPRPSQTVSAACVWAGRQPACLSVLLHGSEAVIAR